jgi:hypothetical protein
MKKIIAIAALIASTQASAFWDFNDNNGMAFNMSASGNARGNSHNTYRSYGYNAPYGYAPYYAPVAPLAPAALPEAAR